MIMEFIKELGYSILIGLVIMVAVTEVFQKEIEFSLIVGIPAGPGRSHGIVGTDKVMR